MKWITKKLDSIKNNTPIYSACGDDCAVCPRYLAQTEEELHQTAQFWYKIGWRDHIVSNDEIRCKGCGSKEECTYMMIYCKKEHGVQRCNECSEFECDKIHTMLEHSAQKQEQCRLACDNEEEYKMLVRAFYEKEKYL